MLSSEKLLPIVKIFNVSSLFRSDIVSSGLLGSSDGLFLPPHEVKHKAENKMAHPL